jgi:antitoxin component YwqK of YwqJK toxin-antitoxin module
MKKFIFLGLSLILFACNDTVQESKKKEVLERKVEQVTEYYPNGKKKLEGETVNGERHGTWKYYYSNGYLWSEGEFWYGERKGYSIVYYNSGKKQMEGAYKKDLKVGKWKLWNEDGSLNKVVDIDQMLTAKDSVKLELMPGKS